jgi:hypothetical protein
VKEACFKITFHFLPTGTKGKQISIYNQSNSSRLEFGRGANNPAHEKFVVTKSWRRPSPTHGRSAGKEEEEEKNLSLRESRTPTLS